eukprot:TRINITY_DN1891_c0_g1_i1.p1 TRINITY_DN1891_c0_g1~~TRINITY_DN1891_c0_g1_i1.p1  ORF type:complete len:208 (-),score=40.71 TRINITY_DN1891_c0_g1_i1:46-669(-)
MIVTFDNINIAAEKLIISAPDTNPNQTFSTPATNYIVHCAIFLLSLCETILNVTTVVSLLFLILKLWKKASIQRKWPEDHLMIGCIGCILGYMLGLWVLLIVEGNPINLVSSEDDGNWPGYLREEHVLSFFRTGRSTFRLMAIVWYEFFVGFFLFLTSRAAEEAQEEQAGAQGDRREVKRDDRQPQERGVVVSIVEGEDEDVAQTDM